MALFCFIAVPEQDECLKSVYFPVKQHTEKLL